VTPSPLWLIGVGNRLPYGWLKPGKKSSCLTSSRFTVKSQGRHELFIIYGWAQGP
jgi:hypothetical protein